MLWRNLVMGIVFLLAAACPARAADPSADVAPAVPAPYTRYVFMIVVGGLDQKDLQQSVAPNIEGLANAGVQFKEVGGVQPNTLAATCATLITGLDPAAHDYVKAGDSLTCASLPALLEQKKVATALVGGGKDTAGLWAARWEKTGPFPSDEAAVEAAIAGVEADHSFFNLLVLNGAEDVAKTDTAVGRLLQYLQQKGVYDQSLIVVTGTGDHPPLIMRARQLKEGAILPAAGLVDVAPTVAQLVGVPLPAPEGLVLWDAMKTQAGENESYLLNRRLNDLSLALLAAREKIYDLQENERQVIEEKARVEAERESYGQAIRQRDGEIDRLRLWIKVIRSLVLLGLAASAAGYFVLCRFLKRKYLFFV